MGREKQSRKRTRCKLSKSEENDQEMSVKSLTNTEVKITKRRQTNNQNITNN